MWISGTFQASPPENILYKNSTHKKSKQNIDTIKSNKSLFPTGSQFDTLIPTSLRRSGNQQQLCLHLHREGLLLLLLLRLLLLLLLGLLLASRLLGLLLVRFSRLGTGDLDLDRDLQKVQKQLKFKIQRLFYQFWSKSLTPHPQCISRKGKNNILAVQLWRAYANSKL